MNYPELPVIQKTYDLIKWYVPLLNKLPRDHKFVLGDRIQGTLHRILEDLIKARYRKVKLDLLDGINAELEVLRYQTRLCHEFALMDTRRFEFAIRQINAVGEDLGGWIKQQKRAATRGS